MSAGKNRDQKGQWIRVAPCLYRYRSSGVYYAVVRRSGKLIRRSLETDTIEVAKRKLRDFLGEQEHAASDAHKTYLDVHMKEFLAGRTGAPKTLKRYRQLTDHVCANWPGGAHQVLAKVDHSQCSKWLSQWNGKVAAYNHARQWLLAFFDFATANRKIQRSPMDKRLVKAMRRPQVIRNAPTPQEFEAILTEVRAQPFTDHADDSADVLEFMGRAGLGQAETSGLKWEHINFKDETIKLFRVKTQTSFQIPLFARLRPLLERLRAENPDASASDKVFKISDPKKALATACRNLKLPAFSARSDGPGALQTRPSDAPMQFPIPRTDPVSPTRQGERPLGPNGTETRSTTWTLMFSGGEDSCLDLERYTGKLHRSPARSPGTTPTDWFCALVSPTLALAMLLADGPSSPLEPV